MAAIRNGKGKARTAATVIGVAAALVGCATTQLDAQWVNPQLSPGSLRGARVMVACEAQEMVIRQLCQDQLAAEVVARGATPVQLPPATAPADDGYTQAARTHDAKVILVQRIAPYGSTMSPGLSVGLGGFGFGRGSGVGVGVSAPLGGGQITTGYAADTRLTAAGTGRLLWTPKASSPPSQG